MTAAELARLPASVFARPYRDQRWIRVAASGVRAARRHLASGNTSEFLFAISRASMHIGMAEAATPSWGRVCRALGSLMGQASRQLVYVGARR